MAPTFSLRLTEDGEWIHSRTVYSLYGSAAPKNLIKKIQITLPHSIYLSQIQKPLPYTDTSPTFKYLSQIQIPLPYSDTSPTLT